MKQKGMEKIEKTIRVLHVIGIMNRGGAETMIMNLYRHIDRRIIQFDFVENSNEQAAFDEEIHSMGGNVYRCPHYDVRNHFVYKRWWEDFFKTHHTEYTVVHGHLGSTAAIYLNIARKYKLFTIAHSHNTSGKSLIDIVYQIYAYPTRYIADCFFACSLDAGISRYGNRVCLKKTKEFHILKNAIETKRFEYNPIVRNQVRKQYHLENRKVIGHVGRFVTQKNHSFLIDIFKKVHDMDNNTILLLVGDGELKKDIDNKVKHLGIQDAVIFTGVQSDVVRFYQAMDLFVFPSLYEGLGIVAVEAQCTGLRCIISDKVSSECIVTDHQVSVCSLRDAVETWANHVLKRMNYKRTNSSEQVKKRGYDILQTSRWLTSFYLKKANIYDGVKAAEEMIKG